MCQSQGPGKMRNSQIKRTKPGFLLLGPLGQNKNIKRGQSMQGMREARFYGESGAWASPALPKGKGEERVISRLNVCKVLSWGAWRACSSCNGGALDWESGSGLFQDHEASTGLCLQHHCSFMNKSSEACDSHGPNVGLWRWELAWSTEGLGCSTKMQLSQHQGCGLKERGGPCCEHRHWEGSLGGFRAPTGESISYTQLPGPHWEASLQRQRQERTSLCPLFSF